MSAIVDELATLFRDRGAVAYFGEDVTATEHMLQCAALAEQEGADDALVCAALLHDIGHLISPDAGEEGDPAHDRLGGAFLDGRFPAAVVEPVRLHVAAKRWLCAAEPGYLAGLSPVSRRSLDAQGGPMDLAERQAFEASPHFSAAVRLRRWDEGGKAMGRNVPGFDHYRPRLDALAVR